MIDKFVDNIIYELLLQLRTVSSNNIYRYVIYLQVCLNDVAAEI